MELLQKERFDVGETDIRARLEHAESAKCARRLLVGSGLRDGYPDDPGRLGWAPAAPFTDVPFGRDEAAGQVLRLNQRVGHLAEHSRLREPGAVDAARQEHEP